MPQTNQAADEVQTLRIEKDLFIAAAPEIVWESVLEEVGPQHEQDVGDDGQVDDVVETNSRDEREQP